MTTAIRCYAKCPKCGADVDTFTPFSRWMRALPSPHDSGFYDLQNLDYIWFNYRAGWVITMEEKRHNGATSPNQADTHGLVAQALTFACASGLRFHTLRGDRAIDYRGHYVVVFEKTTPDDSAWIRINGVVCDKAAIMRLLSSGSAHATAAPQRVSDIGQTHAAKRLTSCVRCGIP